jgi:hypothetical protein
LWRAARATVVIGRLWRDKRRGDIGSCSNVQQCHDAAGKHGDHYQCTG